MDGTETTMADDKKEPWLNLLALTTVILAVCATMATFKGGGYSTKAVLSQAQASDQWAFYQAKSIKGNLYEVEAMRLKREVELAPKTAVPVLERSLADVEKKVVKYDGEKADISKKATAFEEAKVDAQKHGAPFGLAVIFLQIAILLSSIAALMKKQPVYWAGLVVGVVGLVYFANGFLLFFPV
jgi:hypothetical protein